MAKKVGANADDRNECAERAMGNFDGTWEEYLEMYSPTKEPIYGPDGQVVGTKITPKDPNEGVRRALENYLARQLDD